MNLNQKLSVFVGDKTLRHTFETLAKSYCSDAKYFGKNILASQGNFEKFQTLPENKQREIINTFSSYYTMLRKAHQSGVDIHSSLSITWWAIKQLNLRPPSDLFDQLEENDVLEIYSPDHIQIFRSFNFFDLTSYSVEDIFSYSWPELYSRSEFITKRMYDVASKVISGEFKGVTITDFPPHVVSCIFSPEKDWILMKHKLFASLLSEDNRIFLFNCFKVIDRKKPEVQ